MELARARLFPAFSVAFTGLLPAFPGRRAAFTGTRAAQTRHRLSVARFSPLSRPRVGAESPANRLSVTRDRAFCRPPVARMWSVTSAGCDGGVSGTADGGRGLSSVFWPRTVPWGI